MYVCDIWSMCVYVCIWSIYVCVWYMERMYVCVDDVWSICLCVFVYVVYGLYVCVCVWNGYLGSQMVTLFVSLSSSPILFFHRVSH